VWSSTPDVQRVADLQAWLVLFLLGTEDQLDMDDPLPDRRALEDLWRSRLTDAQIRHDSARNHREEVARDLLVGHIPDGNGAFAYREALLAEKMALVEYQRVLDIFAALVVGGKTPEERDWPRSKEDDEG
jgi:hypothetical protein